MLPMQSGYTEEGHAFSELILEVFRLNGVLLTEGDRLTRPVGLTSARWQVLGAIAAHERGGTVASLARDMGLNRQGVQRIVGELAREGIVELLDNPRHRRARLVTMTPRGRDLYESIFERQRPWTNQIAAGVGADQIGFAASVLRRLRERLLSGTSQEDAA